MDINFGCFYCLANTPSRVFKCVGMCCPYNSDGEDCILISEVRPNGNSTVLTYIPIEDFLEQFEQLGN